MKGGKQFPKCRHDMRYALKYGLRSLAKGDLNGLSLPRGYIFVKR
jgi:hypothetical protein